MIITNIIEGGMSSPIIGTNYSQRPAISTRFTEEMRKMNTKPEKSGMRKSAGSRQSGWKTPTALGHITPHSCRQETNLVSFDYRRNAI